MLVVEKMIAYLTTLSCVYDYYTLVYYSKLKNKMDKKENSVQEKHTQTVDEKLSEETKRFFSNSLIESNIRKYNGSTK
jgi:hypothetical protein